MATHEEFYRAVQDKNADYLGVVYVAVKTTGVFCRIGCPARVPKPENCEFYATAQAALLAGYRPCKRCRPLSHPFEAPEIVQKLVDAVEAEPEKKWRAADLAAFYADASTVRRQFRKRFGMTFIAYARARRMGIAMKQIRAGVSVIDAQVATGYESGSGFRDAFARIMGSAPARATQTGILKASWIDTALGPMIAIADEERLHLLEFTDRRGLEREIERLRARTKSAIVPGCTAPLESIAAELRDYFAGTLVSFATPLAGDGSAFQRRVWDELRRIPSGETRSYTDLAAAVGRPTAVRAVAQANGANTLAIIVPCHRITGVNGDLRGYGGGIARKKWLIEHEAAGIRLISRQES